MFWPALSITFFRLLMICCKFLTLLFIALLLSELFIMLTRNAKTSMNFTGKDAKTGKDADPSNTEFVSLATQREMLQIQKRMFKNMFESFLSSLNTRIDDVVKSVAELKASLEYSQQDIDDLKEAADAIDDMDEELEDIQRGLHKHKEKLEYLENQSRRNNIRIDGIPEEDNETWLNTETKAKEVLQEKLHLSFEPVIERAHRTADGINTCPSTIVCRLRDWKQKDEILRAARKTKPPSMFLSEDLGNETMEKRKAQLDKLKETKRAGKISYFVLDRLVIKDRRRVQLISSFIYLLTPLLST